MLEIRRTVLADALLSAAFQNSSEECGFDYKAATDTAPNGRVAIEIGDVTVP
jgi:hypothetical protein